MQIKITTPVINILFQYVLLPLNLVLIVWIVLMNHAFVRPTALPTSYPIRMHGYWKYTTIYMALCVFSVVVGLTNVFVVYSAFKNVSRRMKKFKSCSTFSCCRETPIYKFYAACILVLIASYGLIASIAFRDLFARKAYHHACVGYSLMADIYVLPSFPSYDGPGSPIEDASARIDFYKDGAHQYTMDLIRGYNQSVGWQEYYQAAESKDNTTDEGWSGFDLALLWTNPELKESAGGGHSYQSGLEYFNMTKMTLDQSFGKNVTVPGPVSNAGETLTTGRFIVTFTNTSAPGFPATTQSGAFTSYADDLDFSSLRGIRQSQPGLQWRFTDHVCLPPRVALKAKTHLHDEIVGSVMHGCRNYRMCALRLDHKKDGGSEWQEWWQYVEGIWSTTVGLVTWEVETYTECCLRKE